jgi:hypothetical protein
MSAIPSNLYPQFTSGPIPVYPVADGSGRAAYFSPHVGPSAAPANPDTLYEHAFVQIPTDQVYQLAAQIDLVNQKINLAQAQIKQLNAEADNARLRGRTLDREGNNGGALAIAAVVVLAVGVSLLASCAPLALLFGGVGVVLGIQSIVDTCAHQNNIKNLQTEKNNKIAERNSKTGELSHLIHTRDYLQGRLAQAQMMA